MIDGHPGLLAKLLAKRPLAAALLLAETLQNKGADGYKIELIEEKDAGKGLGN